MVLITQLEKLLTPVLAHRGLDLVRVQLSGQRPPVLQIMIEHLDKTSVTINDCTGASREISALLDVEDPLEGPYRLEVTSPGLDRPLTKIQDFQRFVGHEIKFQTHEAKEGQKNFTGVLEKASKKSVQVRLKDKNAQIMEVPYEDIRQARLIPQF